ncbi:MAG: Fur family transcriptional regulator [Chloroflexota bacterium]
MKKIFIMAGGAVDHALERMSQQGFRLTRPRRAVVRALLEAGDWLRPEDVRIRARKHCRSVGLVTVYRTLTLLEQLGIAQRVHVEPGCHGYAAASLSHGHHLVCRSCHQVIEFPGSEDLAPFIKRVARQTGFQVEDHLLELTGLCASCR